MPITKPAVRDAWAFGATTSADIVDPGDTFVDAGWLMSTTPPARQYFNWVLNYAGNAVSYFMRRGVSDYDAAETYQVGDIAIGDTGTLVQSLTSNQIGNLPSASPANWGPLAGYMTSAQITNAITTALLPYVQTATFTSTLAAYVTQTTFTTTLAGYVTNASLAATLGNYVTNGTLAATLANYATVASLSAYQTLASFAASIANYSTTVVMNALLAAKANLDSPAFFGVPQTPTAPPGTNNTQIASCAFALASAGGTNLLSGNGWANIPGGLEFRWGSVAHTVVGPQAHNFTTPFTHACFVVVPSVASSTGVEFFTVVGGSETANGWQQYANNATTVNYFAIGF
jgi:hypothetical protein